MNVISPAGTAKAQAGLGSSGAGWAVEGDGGDTPAVMDRHQAAGQSSRL